MNGLYPINGGQHLKLDSINPRAELVKCQILLRLLSIWLDLLGHSLAVEVVVLGRGRVIVDKSLLQLKTIQLLDLDSFEGLYYRVPDLMEL